ncbi:MAG: hypothetical protein C4295_01875 [Candidatus Fervidibacterota bacterium]
MRRPWRYFRLFGVMTLVFAVVLGIYLSIRRRPSPAPKPTVQLTPPKARVVVAVADLPPRTLLTPRLVMEQEVPQTPSGAFASKEKVVNRVTLTLIRKGEPIFQQHVSPPLTEVSAAYLVPPGKVGMALAVARRDLVPPLRSGDYISIHAVFGGVKVRTLVPRAMVLAINNRIGDIVLTGTPSPPQPAATQQAPSPPAGEERLVLLVSLFPKEAKAVALAIDSGATLYYTLLPAPVPLLVPPEMERDLTLRELTGSERVEALLLRKQHGELPPSSSSTPTKPNNLISPPHPVVLAPSSPRLQALERSVQTLHQRLGRLEQEREKAVTPTAAKRHQIVGVVGDQRVVLTVPDADERGGRP